jgi:peptidoglycan/xylan/chitin deacetylase (PgdA/CDA1 family)
MGRSGKEANVSGSAVVCAVAGTRATVRTADSTMRQTHRFDEVILASPSAPAPLFVQSIAARTGAIVTAAAGRVAAVNCAAARAAGDYIALIPAGFRLHRDCHERCAAILHERQDIGLVVPGIRVHSPDGRWSHGWRFDVAAGAIGHPRNTPPVMFVRRTLWSAAGGLDPALPALADYEWWIRAIASNFGIREVDEVLVMVDADDERTWRSELEHPAYLEAYRTILERHRAVIERHMVEVLVDREVGFGVLRQRHTDLVARRDTDLAELERLRAAAAHHRAFIAHHGRDAVDWGDLRRPDPISRDWGYERGTPIDRYYIESFISAHASDVRGRVLEVQEDDLTRRHGGPRVSSSAVLDLDDRNTRATVIADLRCAREVASDEYDCVILTQTVHVIDDMTAVFRECYRILRPGGVLLATLPCASRVCLEYGEDGDLWRVTPAGARVLAEAAFPPAGVQCTPYGNVLANVAFLQGLACSELTDEEFDAFDPFYPALVGVRAQKPVPQHRGANRWTGQPRTTASTVVLLYHRVEDAEDERHGLNVTRTAFERHIEWLRRDCHVVPLDDLVAASREGLSERTVAITFDDGYLDNLQIAAPLLAAAGLPSTFFVTTRWLNQPGEYWWDLLERALFGTHALPPIVTVRHDGRGLSLPTGDVEDRRRSHADLHGILVHATLPERDAIVMQLTAMCGADGGVRRPLLADELRVLAAMPGVTIGAHTVNHLALPDQPADVQHRELEECRTALERVIGTRVTLAAYPYGAFDRHTANAVRARWHAAMTCEGRALARSFDPALVPRLEVKNWDVQTLQARLAAVWKGP